MTDAILGHDCDGRELRVGDRVTVVRAIHACLVGADAAILSPSRRFVGCVRTNIRTDEGGHYVFPPEWLCLINSGRELFDQCAREADKMPTESTIRQRMPWTEPEES